MAHDIFISYASEDKAIADAVCATLEGRKIRCWIAPRDILPGQPYAESLIDGLNHSKILVLIFSKNSNNSQQVMREIERGVNKGIPIIPVRIEDVTPTKSMEYFLSAPHWLDAMTPPLERHLQKLADAIETLLPNESASQVRSGSQAADHTDQRSTIANTFDSSQRVALPSDLQPKSIPEVLRAGSGIQPNLAGALCYAAGWITGIIFLLLEKDNKFIRFQAVQSIVTFGAITFIWIFLPYVGFLGTILSWMLGIIALILWFVLMYKAYRNEIYKLPVAGDIAEKQSRFKPEPR